MVVFGLLLASCAAGPAGPPTGPGPVLDVLLGDRRTTLPRAELVARAALAPDQDVRVVEIGRDAHTSHHVVGIRSGEPLHRHERHDLIVVVLEGHGRMRLGDTTRPVGQGSVVYTPRGAVHAFTNAGERPAYAHVVYSPPYDGEDRVLVGE